MTLEPLGPDPVFSLLLDGLEVLQDVRTQEPLMFTRGLDGTRVISPPVAGQAILVLNNQEGTYGPGTVAKGESISFEELGAIDGTPRLLWSGVLEDPIRRRSQRDSIVEILGYGNLSRFIGKRISTELLEDITVDEALHLICDALDIPMDMRDFDVGHTVLKYWWLGDIIGPRDAFNAMVELVYTEGPGAALYELRDGTIAFRNRYHLMLEERSTQTQWDVTDVSQPSASNLEYDDSLKDVYNYAEIAYVHRHEHEEEVIWQLGEDLVLGENELHHCLAFTDSRAPVKDAQTPTEGGDDFTITAGSLQSLTIGRTSGGIIPIDVQAGPTGVTLTGLRLRAKPLEIDHHNAVRSRSITLDPDEELRPWDKPVLQDISMSDAQFIADTIPPWYREGRSTLILELRGSTPEKLEMQLDVEVGDRILVQDANMPLDEEFWVINIRHRVVQGKLLVTHLQCEKVLDTAYGVWDIGRWDISIWG